MKLTKGKIIAGVLAACLLAAAFFLPELKNGAQPPSSGSAPAGDAAQSPASPPSTGVLPSESGPAASEDSSTPPPEPSEEPSAPAPQESGEAAADPPSQAAEDAADPPSQESGGSEDPPETLPPEETQPPETEPAAPTCTLSVSCAAVLDNMDLLIPGKEELIPADGWLLAPVEVEFAEGETAFDVLRRELKSRNLHFEYNSSPLYGTAYIEGICNLYEYDCGELSGWEFSVNGLFPSYSPSQFTLTDGDAVAWIYTCDLGADVGDEA